LGRDDVAERFLANAQQSFERISGAPHAGAPKQTRNLALEGLRSLAIAGFETTRIYYLVRDDAILVIRVLHGRRDVAAIIGDDDDALTD
jgi:toxin ParE1/3/4